MRQEILDRLNRALSDMYHNATPSYPWDLYDEYDKLADREGAAMDEFYNLASFEIDYLNDGGGVGCIPYGTMKHNAALHTYAKRMKNRQYYRELYAYPWQRIFEFGRLYTYGRGGRTLAPDDLMTTRSNPRQYDPGEINAERATDMIRIIESFNKYVASWNSEENLRAIFKEEIEQLRSELKAQNSDLRAKCLALIKDIKSQSRKAGPVCDTLRDAVQSYAHEIEHNRQRLA